MEVSIKRLKANEWAKFVKLVKVFEDVFEMENLSIPKVEHLRRLLSRNNFHVFVALLDNKVVGGLTTYMLEQYYSDKPLAYIYDLAVDAKLQRQGIGKRLIAETCKFYKKKGSEVVFVQVDKADKHAIDFYRKTKPSGEDSVVHFSYTLEK